MAFGQSGLARVSFLASTRARPLRSTDQFYSAKLSLFAPRLTPETLYYENARGVRVTDRFISTKFKDEALAPIESVQVGRELLLIALVCGGALLASAYRFSDLLYSEEQIILAGVAALMILVSACIAPLRIGRYAHEKTILWANIWTVNAVRRAIAKAGRENLSDGRAQSIYDDDAA